MAREAFLINPPKRVSVGSERFKLHNNSKRRKARKFLDNAWYETPTGTKKFSVKHSTAAIKGAKRHKSIVSQLTANAERRKHRSNPLGEGLMLIGGNPPMKHRRRKHAKKHKGFLSFLDNPMRSSHRLRHSKKRRHNPAGRRRHRRNPAAVAGSELSLKNPMSFAMPAMIGVGGAVAAAYIPTWLGYTATKADGSTDYTNLLLKIGIGAGGAMFLKGTNRIAWVAGVAAGLIAPWVESALAPAKSTTKTTAGLGAFLPGSFSIPMIPQAPAKPAQYGAFPNEFSAYPSESITPY